MTKRFPFFTVGRSARRLSAGERESLWSPVIWIAAMVVLCGPGCALTEKKLTSSGSVQEPRMAWNGAHFGIVYYYRPAAGSPLTIDAMKVDNQGQIAATKEGPASGIGVYTPFLLSHLVWSDVAQQFAFTQVPET